MLCPCTKHAEKERKIKKKKSLKFAEYILNTTKLAFQSGRSRLRQRQEINTVNGKSSDDMTKSCNREFVYTSLMSVKCHSCTLTAAARIPCSPIVGQSKHPPRNSHTLTHKKVIKKLQGQFLYQHFVTADADDFKLQSLHVV